jgi:hypothetical protein
MKKIMFNDKYGLTQAVLDGRKTMTRRIITDKKLHYWMCSCPDMVIVRVPDLNKINTGDDNVYFGIKEKISDGYYCDTIVSPYKVGEVVAIAQSYKDIGYNGEYSWVQDGIHYHRDRAAGWANKMFVKADLMPHHIKITGIKVERLQDISDEDCLKEGIIHASTFLGQKIYHTPHVNGSYLSTNVAQEAFAYLIDKVSGKGAWESNPFVFAYEFVLFD